MAYLNANIPATYAQIRKEYLYDLKKHHGEVEACIIFGLSSIAGHSILFHAIMCAHLCSCGISECSTSNILLSGCAKATVNKYLPSCHFLSLPIYFPC